MSDYLRQSAYNDGGTFSNSDLLWYAKGVQVMQSRSLDDPSSWWFFGAIHGESIESLNPRFRGSANSWDNIPAPPKVPVSPVPDQAVRDKFWNQCQHTSWYFAPWHRGYLIALEEQVRAAIISLGGPSNWALPYWNYFGNQQMPPAFATKTLPDGSANPLFVEARYGPNGDGDIYVPQPQVNQDCQQKTVYTNDYGGPVTPFVHFGSGALDSHALENNPHNYVHGFVGGRNSDSYGGLMGDPRRAALDPIFYLHHCQIDRMWAAWNAMGNANPADSNWLNGPSGKRKFVMPTPTNPEWVYTPEEMEDYTQFYQYETLDTMVVSPLAHPLAKRMRRLGVALNKEIEIGDLKMKKRPDRELLGASRQAMKLTGSGGSSKVRIDSGGQNKLNRSLKMAAPTSIPDKVHLVLENVQGNEDANFLTVYLNGQEVGLLSLFGLTVASDESEHEAGGGLTFSIDITDKIDALHLDGGFSASDLEVEVKPKHELTESETMTIGRVSLYREPQ
jgi:tyrosinase